MGKKSLEALCHMQWVSHRWLVCHSHTSQHCFSENLPILWRLGLIWGLLIYTSSPCEWFFAGLMQIASGLIFHEAISSLVSGRKWNALSKSAWGRDFLPDPGPGEALAER
jgi:hypothetical protein